jgi:hypothetical protein
MHDMRKPDPPTPIRFVNMQCPKCHLVTPHVTLQTSSMVSCSWTDCGQRWIQQEGDVPASR